jgi:hypothetical protein
LYAIPSRGGLPLFVSNSQDLIRSYAAEQGKGNRKAESAFLTQWKNLLKAQGVDAEPEDMTFAWRKGGEAHCASNGIREPIKK